LTEHTTTGTALLGCEEARCDCKVRLSHDLSSPTNTIVLQGTDLYDGLEICNTEIPLYHFVFLQLAMIDDGSNIILSYSSNSLPYSGGCIDFGEEEFLFENVLQTNSIRVALFASKGTGKKNINVCGGEVQIPMNRLEENIPVCFRLCSLDSHRWCNGTSSPPGHPLHSRSKLRSNLKYRFLLSVSITSFRSVSFMSLALVSSTRVA
jgi:hypothetical protein